MATQLDEVVKDVSHINTKLTHIDTTTAYLKTRFESLNTLQHSKGVAVKEALADFKLKQAILQNDVTSLNTKVDSVIAAQTNINSVLEQILLAVTGGDDVKNGERKVGDLRSNKDDMSNKDDKCKEDKTKGVKRRRDGDDEGNDSYHGPRGPGGVQQKKFGKFVKTQSQTHQSGTGHGKLGSKPDSDKKKQSADSDIKKDEETVKEPRYWVCNQASTQLRAKKTIGLGGFSDSDIDKTANLIVNPQSLTDKQFEKIDLGLVS